jgi:hypothetical protein
VQEPETQLFKRFFSSFMVVFYVEIANDEQITHYSLCILISLEIASQERFEFVPEHTF